MAFTTNASGSATYTIKNSDEEFTTSEITLAKEESSTFSSEYKEETHQQVNTYTADSEHGTFTWITTTTSSTYSAQPEIESELTLSPSKVVDISEEPTFEIIDDDE